MAEEAAVIPPMSKRRPDSRQVVVVSSIDRLSNLPDSVICRILSFLTTKEAVSTSVLAERWKSLWTDVPTLRFAQIFYNDMGPNRMGFANIVSRVLLLHNNTQPLNKFVLSAEVFVRSPMFESWMMAVVARGVMKLSVSLGYDAAVVFVPHCLFNCKTLVKMRLSKGLIIPANRNVRLPCLKKLHLSCVRYENDESLPTLLSGCPVLEDLAIYRWPSDNMFICDISSPTLRTLKLYFELNDVLSADKYRLSITAPALRFFCIHDSSYYHISAGTLSRLAEAEIALFDPGVEDDAFGYSVNVVKLVERLHNVKFLKFRSDVKYQKLFSLGFVGSAFFAASAKFYNLTKLEFDADWCLLSTFIGFADNLEVLIIRKVDDELKCWREPSHVPECMLSCLGTVCIQVEGKEVEFSMLRYILQNSKVLRRMEIDDKYISHDKELKCNVHQQIASFPRGSNTCEVAFV